MSLEKKLVRTFNNEIYYSSELPLALGKNSLGNGMGIPFKTNSSSSQIPKEEMSPISR